MAEAVTEVISAPDQGDPVIERVMVEVPELDAAGKPTGQMVEQEQVRGNVKYSTHLVPPGQEEVQALTIGGVLKDVKRWTAQALDGRNAIVESRLLVNDNCEQSEMTQPEPEEL